MKSKKRYITKNKIDQKEYKNKTRFPKKGANTHTHSYTPTQMKVITFFLQTNLLKRKIIYF